MGKKVGKKEKKPLKRPHSRVMGKGPKGKGKRIGLFIGRFQPFHNAHLRDVLEAIREVDILHIGIGSSNEERTENNPFSFKERKGMIEAALREKGIERFTILGVPDFNDDAKWMGFIKENVPSPDAVFMGNKETEQLFCRYGYEAKCLAFVEGISATIVRSMIRDDKRWEDLVPKAVARKIKQNNLLEKIKK